MDNKHELILTSDGSHTIKSLLFNATYHSVHGAIQESTHVFLQAGLQYILAHKTSPIRLLEFGFGTGLNALLSAIWPNPNNITIHYTSIESYPISGNQVLQLNYPQLLSHPQSGIWFENIHHCRWGSFESIHPNFELRKINADFNEWPQDSNYDLIYLDAFAPSIQSTFWENPFLEKLFSNMNNGTALLSYCAKGSFKRALKQAGFIVEGLPGPPGKREMTRAIKA
jgi:tRNA U34 5-methylaminomethyl-2-thiouridine-forming methyltransferase MnmC